MRRRPARFGQVCAGPGRDWNIGAVADTALATSTLAAVATAASPEAPLAGERAAHDTRLNSCSSILCRFAGYSGIAEELTRAFAQSVPNRVCAALRSEDRCHVDTDAQTRLLSSTSRPRAMQSSRAVQIKIKLRFRCLCWRMKHSMALNT